MVQRGIFGPKRGEVTEDRKKLDYMGLNDLYCSATIFRVIKIEINRIFGTGSAYGGEECCIKGLGVET